MPRFFAPDYPRTEDGELVVFPKADTVLRRQLFPSQNIPAHVVKANMYMVKALIEFVSEPGETVCDPFAGTGTILVGATIGRKIICLELEQPFVDMIESAINDLRSTVPNIDELSFVMQGDLRSILPISDFANHFIFSPPYANVLAKKSIDKTTADLGYSDAILYGADPNNIANLPVFMYHQVMEKVYKKIYDSLTVGGTMTIIIKDKMEAGVRNELGKRACRDCERLGFKLMEWNRWKAMGGAFAAVNRQHGLETVNEEELITLIKEK
jgi:DNA modification methylase